MNQNIILIVSFLIFGFSESRTSKDSSENSKIPLKEIDNPRVSDIPQSIIDTLNNLTENEFKLANPNKKFQATDNIRLRKKLPHRQLRCIVTDGELWQIAYKHGGRGLHYHLIECKVTIHGVSGLCSFVTLSKLESLTDIERMKNEGEMRKCDITSSTESDKF